MSSQDEIKEERRKKLEIIKKRFKETGYMAEKFVDDEELIKEYRTLYDPFKKRAKFILYYWAFCLFLGFKYIKNIDHYSKFFPKLKSKFGSLFFLSTLHTLVFNTILFGGTFLILQIRPIKFLKQVKSVNDRMVEKDIMPDITLDEFLEVTEMGNLKEQGILKAIFSTNAKEVSIELGKKVEDIDSSDIKKDDQKKH